ncbi:histone-lysine N-trimethyltransferase SMYD5-like [Ostrea edulis]|uniref:histone-lysine N-trimethyltransferase SMYD5-like n=1 Tax=Ostrea edulis TaxID=37623 RepID=UPI0020955C3C|nr:histone-lysine N-trimethyltransferase SMYD5-like [Ostrea edulis]
MELQKVEIMAAFCGQLHENNVEISVENIKKGKSLIAKQNFEEGDVLFEERPVVSSQFLWNEFYKYTACEYCLRSLETAENQSRRLTENEALTLPYPECDETKPSQYVKCPQCQVTYCCQECQKNAWKEYHQILCMGSSKEDENHPLYKLQDMWRNIHFPPESCSIMLIAKMIALVKQSTKKCEVLEKFSRFVKTTVNEEEALVHKMMGEKFQEPLELLRQQVTEILFEDAVQSWFTPEGFQSLFAIVGRNGQGIGSSSISSWVKNCEKLELSQEKKEELDLFIDTLYEELENVSGSFLDCEGSGLYLLQSTCNHSCLPNAEITFPYNNNIMSVIAKEKIASGQEICISYLSECDMSRSRHSRQKYLKENYLFVCQCPKCLSEADEPDVTSDEEEEDMDDDGDQ